MFPVHTCPECKGENWHFREVTKIIPPAILWMNIIGGSIFLFAGISVTRSGKFIGIVGILFGIVSLWVGLTHRTMVTAVRFKCDACEHELDIEKGNVAHAKKWKESELYRWIKLKPGTEVPGFGRYYRRPSTDD